MGAFSALWSGECHLFRRREFGARRRRESSASGQGKWSRAANKGQGAGAGEKSHPSRVIQAPSRAHLDFCSTSAALLGRAWRIMPTSRKDCAALLLPMAMPACSPKSSHAFTRAPAALVRLPCVCLCLPTRTPNSPMPWLLTYMRLPPNASTPHARLMALLYPSAGPSQASLCFPSLLAACLSVASCQPFVRQAGNTAKHPPASYPLPLTSACPPLRCRLDPSSRHN